MLTGILPAIAWGAPQVTCNPNALHFGRIVIGQTETLPATLTNTQSTSLTITAVNTASAEFTTDLQMPLTLTAGQTVNFNVRFTPTASGWQGGWISFTSSTANRIPGLEIGGFGVTSAAVVPNPTTLGFGSVAVGQTSTLAIALSNSSNTGIAITQAQVTGAGFAVSGLNLPAVLGPNQSLSFNVTFTPQSAGAVSGNLVVPNAAISVPLTGTGLNNSQLILSPASLSFGNVDVGSTSTQPITLSANGGSVTLNSSASSNSEFALQGASYPLTIGSGQSVSLSVVFSPNTSGKASGSLSLASNASNSTVQEGLSGTGVSPTYSVTVSWNASVSSVVGYNIYRSTTPSGTFSKVNTSLNPGTTFTDTSVNSGQTYYYAATSVSSSGQESTYSTPVQAVVP